MNEGRPAVAFLAGQAVNIAWTCGVPVVRGSVFPVPGL